MIINVFKIDLPSLSMVCDKCGYIDKGEKQNFDKNLCSVCSSFAPMNKQNFESYVKEKVDWKVLDTFRKYGQKTGDKQKSGMQKKAKQGNIVTRAPFGYEISDGKLWKNQNASKVHALFKEFLEKDKSLNILSQEYGFSLNGLKKVLSNRTYLGEIKFAGKLSKGIHEKLISDEIFYAVQRKLKEKLRS